MKKPLKINWKKLRNNIPKKIQLSNRHIFDVKLVDSVGKSRNGRKHYGETDFHPKEIRLRRDQTDEQMVKSCFHELLHTFKVYKNMHLTEIQVRAFENKYDVFEKFFLTLHKKRNKISKRKRK